MSVRNDATSIGLVQVIVIVIVIAIHFLPGGTVVIGGLSSLEELPAIKAPQLSTLKAPADARVIDLWVVLTITCLRAAAVGAVAHHDPIDEIFAGSAFVEISLVISAGGPESMMKWGFGAPSGKQKTAYSSPRI